MKMQDQIVSTIKEIDDGKKRVSGTITTEKGTPLYWEVYYDKGGYNQFTNEFEPRCMEASLQRQHGEVAAFSDLNDPAGAERIVLIEVGRYSKKQQKLAIQKFADKLPNFLKENYPSLQKEDT